jgi:hypothetical protein
VSAGPTIARFLADEFGRSGVLTLFTRTTAFSFPRESVSRWEIRVYGTPKPYVRPDNGDAGGNVAKLSERARAKRGRRE